MPQLKTRRCPDCGKQVLAYRLDLHLEECDGSNANEWDGVCPMCAERYESWTTHVLENECGGSEEAAAE